LVCAALVESFLSALLHLSEMDRYIPSHNYIKTFNWVRSPFEVPELQVHCEVDGIAEQLIELQSRQLWSDSILSGCPDNRTKSL